MYKRQGFGGQEGGDSVTDIDNQDVVNQVLDDPNDNIDNLDNPDDDKSSEDKKDNKNVTCLLYTSRCV